MSRFFNGTETTRRLLQNNTRNNSSINETIKAIEDNDRKRVKNFGNLYATLGAIGGVITITGGYKLKQYLRPEEVEEEPPQNIPPALYDMELGQLSRLE